MKRFNLKEQENYQTNMNKIINDLTTLVEGSKPLETIKFTHKGITLTVKVDLEKATK